MKKIQVTLPEALEEKFSKEAEKQGRTRANLAKLFIVAGLRQIKEEELKKSA